MVALSAHEPMQEGFTTDDRAASKADDGRSITFGHEAVKMSLGGPDPIGRLADGQSIALATRYFHFLRLSSPASDSVGHGRREQNGNMMSQDAPEGKRYSRSIRVILQFILLCRVDSGTLD